MNKYDILHEIFHRAGIERFMTIYELETETGLSGAALRPMLEDLKEENLLHEHPEGLQISENGLYYCKSRWA
jgi:predicted TPR repeat methyltransferase